MRFGQMWPTGRRLPRCDLVCTRHCDITSKCDILKATSSTCLYVCVTAGWKQCIHNCSHHYFQQTENNLQWFWFYPDWCIEKKSTLMPKGEIQVYTISSSPWQSLDSCLGWWRLFTWEVSGHGWSSKIIAKGKLHSRYVQAVSPLVLPIDVYHHLGNGDT